MLELPGWAHRNPIPNGVRINDYVFSSALAHHELGPIREIDQCFENMQHLMELAGGGPEDVVLQWIYLNDFKYEPYMLDVYLKYWPIGQYQAARKSFPLNRGSGQIEMQVMGRLRGERHNYEIPNMEHRQPVPAGSRIGDLLCSGGVSGRDTSVGGKLEPAEGAALQAHHSLANVRKLMEQAGADVSNIGHMTLLVQDYNDLPAIDVVWSKMFPDIDSRPARRVMKFGVQGRSRVQSHLVALISE